MQEMWGSVPQVLYPGTRGFSPLPRALKALGLTAILSPLGGKKCYCCGGEGKEGECSNKRDSKW